MRILTFTTEVTELLDDEQVTICCREHGYSIIQCIVELLYSEVPSNKPVPYAIVNQDVQDVRNLCAYVIEY